MKTATQKMDTIRRRMAHHNALASLALDPSRANGMKMRRLLCKLERMAHDATTAQCNGEAFGSQPYRGEVEWESFKARILASIKGIFGHVPHGVYINGDARGHALKLDCDRVPIPEGMDKDWGGNGILAAQID